MILTNLVPELSALVGDWNALSAPQRQPRVSQELLRDQRQHAHTVTVTRM